MPSVDPKVLGSRLPRQRCEALPQPRAATPPVQLLAGFLRGPQVMARVPVDCRQRQTDVGCEKHIDCVCTSEQGTAAHLPNNALLATSSRTDAHTTRGTVQRFCSQLRSTTVFDAQASPAEGWAVRSAAQCQSMTAVLWLAGKGLQCPIGVHFAPSAASKVTSRVTGPAGRATPARRVHPP